MATPPRPSALGVDVVPPIARTDRRGRTSRPGRRVRRSTPSSAPCTAPPAFRSTTSPSSSRILTHFLPHLNRDAVYRILKAEGLDRLRPAQHTRKRHFDVAIDRPSLFLDEALAALAFRITHVLTDRGFCFGGDGFERACERQGVEPRKTRPCTPKTNGVVERFNGREQRTVLGIALYSHQDLERVLSGFNHAYDGRRQRVRKGRAPDMVLRQRLKRKTQAGQAGPNRLPRRATESAQGCSRRQGSRQSRHVVKPKTLSREAAERIVGGN